MVARIWHGYTSKENAAAYEQLLTSKIFKDIEGKCGEDFKGVQLLQREIDEEVEFTTMIWFSDLAAVKKLTGEDFETAFIPEEARALLSHFDEKVRHSHLIYTTGK
ncbi:antibiotic biosynthesis monooxygenase [Salinimicrobium oceani]|uniref:Antibiotic biosynthesis monooxygenase n=1 Tax=Salinimicrobium oceani TaxID=2722702 RepID=A0ABX1CXX6_9FLAO|nr:antibiotic biosynthesis monooxygenase [Salinimicrobium oceani]NJW52007.1 antibiotic biosynthesis monooxygenase [Salinimicrobium oceani]